MPGRFYLTPSDFRVSKPGIEVRGASLNNLLLSGAFRAGQILLHTSVALASGNKNVVVNIGPYSQVPDLYYQFIFSDNKVRVPPAYFAPKQQQYINYNTTKAVITASTVEFTVANVGQTSQGDVPPEVNAIVFVVFRKAQATL